VDGFEVETSQIHVAVRKVKMWTNCEKLRGQIPMVPFVAAKPAGLHDRL
jgi:hypothetical protein